MKSVLAIVINLLPLKAALDFCNIATNRSRYSDLIKDAIEEEEKGKKNLVFSVCGLIPCSTRGRTQDPK